MAPLLGSRRRTRSRRSRKWQPRQATQYVFLHPAPACKLRSHVICRKFLFVSMQWARLISARTVSCQRRHEKHKQKTTKQVCFRMGLRRTRSLARHVRGGTARPSRERRSKCGDLRLWVSVVRCADMSEYATDTMARTSRAVRMTGLSGSRWLHQSRSTLTSSSFSITDHCFQHHDTPQYPRAAARKKSFRRNSSCALASRSDEYRGTTPVVWPECLPLSRRAAVRYLGTESEGHERLWRQQPQSNRSRFAQGPERNKLNEAKGRSSYPPSNVHSSRGGDDLCG